MVDDPPRRRAGDLDREASFPRCYRAAALAICTLGGLAGCVAGSLPLRPRREDDKLPAVGQGTRDETPDPRAAHRALWVWDHGAAALHADARTQLFDFAATHDIDTLYYESSGLVADDPPALASLLNAAAAHGLSVELLFSSNAWIYPQNQAQAVALVRRAARFAAGLQGAEPTALHFDIEPYLLPEWKAGDEERIASDYLDLLGEIEAARGRLPVHVDIPFWFCNTPVAWPSGNAVRPLDQPLLAIVDGCTVMDYRNAAVGSDGIVADGSRTLADAEAAGKPLVIGVETNPVPPAEVTFFRLGSDAVDAQLAIVDDLFEGDPAFAGTAVEDYRGYRELGP